MSKEIAQTVGGKRIAWLVAIIAAFVVFATVGSQFRSAEATPTSAQYTVTGPWTVNDCTGAAPASVPVGTNLYYCVNSAGDSTIAPPLQVTVNVPSTLTVLGATQILGSGPQPSCTFPGVQAICTYSTLNATSTFQLRVDTVTARRGLVPAGGGTAPGTNGAISAGLDDVSNGVSSALNNTVALTITGAQLAITKAHSPGTPVNGGNVTYTLTVTNPVTAVIGAAAVNVQIQDTISAANYAAIQSANWTNSTPTASSGACTGVGAFPDTRSCFSLHQEGN